MDSRRRARCLQKLQGLGGVWSGGEMLGARGGHPGPFLTAGISPLHTWFPLRYKYFPYLTGSHDVLCVIVSCLVLVFCVMVCFPCVEFMVVYFLSKVLYFTQFCVLRLTPYSPLHTDTWHTIVIHWLLNMIHWKVPSGLSRYDGGKGWGQLKSGTTQSVPPYLQSIATLMEMLILWTWTTAHSKRYCNLHIYECIPLFSLSVVCPTEIKVFRRWSLL